MNIVNGYPCYIGFDHIDQKASVSSQAISKTSSSFDDICRRLSCFDFDDMKV